MWLHVEKPPTQLMGEKMGQVRIAQVINGRTHVGDKALVKWLGSLRLTNNLLEKSKGNGKNVSFYDETNRYTYIISRLQLKPG